jgi:hypothetical protein
LFDIGDGIVVGDAHDTLISGNVVIGAGISFPDAGGFGILLDGSDRNTLDRNIVAGGRGPAIFVTILEAATAAEDNVISRNVANSRFSDGIIVDAGAARTVVKSNFANGNGDDGIEVDSPATLTANTANHNQDLGIEAVSGVTDGGGNHAAGNGNPAQCTNLAC